MSEFRGFMRAKSLDLKQGEIAKRLIRKLTQNETSQVVEFCDEGYLHFGCYILDLKKFRDLCHFKYDAKCDDLSAFASVLSDDDFKLLFWLIYKSEIKDFGEYEALLEKKLQKNSKNP